MGRLLRPDEISPLRRSLCGGQSVGHGHWYPLLYSLIAAPFTLIVRSDPFLIPDAILFGLTTVAFVRVMRHLGIGWQVSTGLFVATALVAWPYAKLWVEPWTTTLSAALIWWLIALVTDLAHAGGGDRRAAAPPADRAFGIGLLAGALPLARPTDLILTVGFLLFAGAILYRRGRLAARWMAWVALGLAATVLPYLLLHLAIYGVHVTDYQRSSAALGFAVDDLPWKAAVVLISGHPWIPDATSLQEGFPFMLPGIAGLAATAWLRPAGRLPLLMIAALAIPYCAIFLAYTDLQPPGLWFFSNAHYFKWMMPLLVAGCLLLLRTLAGRETRVAGVTALGLVILPTCIRPLPRLAHDDEPARMLLFHGDTAGFWDRKGRTPVWMKAYFRRARIVDAHGTMTNVGGFHQFPDRHGERAVAVTRLFMPGAVRLDPEDGPAFRGPQRPYARYAVRLSLGPPCWIARRICDREL